MYKIEKAKLSQMNRSRKERERERAHILVFFGWLVLATATIDWEVQAMDGEKQNHKSIFAYVLFIGLKKL